MLSMPIPKVSVPEGTSGPWSVRRFTVTREEAEYDRVMSRIRGSRRYVRAGDYTGLFHGERIIMSDTLDEMRDHLDAVGRATGSVLINGLGLGMVAKAVLMKPEVTDVTVVEIEEDVIRLVAPHIADPRLTVVLADALSYRPPKGKRFGMVWHDIWPDITPENLPEMATLHRRYARLADHQGSWCVEECRRARDLHRRRAA